LELLGDSLASLQHVVTLNELVVNCGESLCQGDQQVGAMETFLAGLGPKAKAVTCDADLKSAQFSQGQVQAWLTVSFI